MTRSESDSYRPHTNHTTVQAKEGNRVQKADNCAYKWPATSALTRPSVYTASVL